MRHAIDPTIDCVFKALLGSERNRALLIHFLNAMLAPGLGAPVVWADILNPYNEREFLDDKLSIVDVKGRDSQGRLYQIEIQLLTVPDLLARMLYTWADLYQAQIHRGDDYDCLKPTFSIWLLGETLLAERAGYAHDFRFRDANGQTLFDHGGIWLLELSKFDVQAVETEQQRWLKSFKDGGNMNSDTLPDWMHTPEMQQAMRTLETFSEQERAYHVYQARETFQRDQRSIQRHLREFQTLAERERARAEQECARAEQETARAAQESARAEQESARAAQEFARAEQANVRADQERARAAQERAAREQEREAKEQALAEIARLKAELRDRNG